MPTELANAVDRRALKILFDRYWTASGWRDEKARTTSAEDFEYAKRAGVMFDDERLSHDDIVDRTLAAVRAVDRVAVADAFVASLSTRRLDLRSALGSFAVFQHFAKHEAKAVSRQCSFCGQWIASSRPEDLNVLNFERFKWGGVRHDQPLYAAIDLELFARLPQVSPLKEDMQVLKAVVQSIRAAPPATTSASLEKNLAEKIKSNKEEREVVIAIFGLCGILGTADHPGYLQRFVPWSQRELPDRRFVDMTYPACWWTRADGVSQEAVDYWFGHVLK